TERALARLSSGQNAPSARYDAAGIAVSSRIRGEIVALQKYQQNAQQGVSMLQVAEGSYQRINDMLMRMRSLAAQAQSSNLSNVERGMLDTEYQQLKLEMNRLAASTRFNGNGLFDTGSIAFNNSATDYASGAFATDAEVADFNGDGIDDMIMRNTGGQVYLYAGIGDGTFASAVAIAVTTAVSAIESGDVNGDGKRDLIITDTNNILVMTGNGDGTFSTLATFTAGGNASNSLTVGDLDGDGIAEIIGTTNGNIAIWSYRNGNFTNTQTLTATIANVSVRLADMNNDGKMDIVTASMFGDNRLQTFIQSSSGGFSAGAVSAAVGFGANDYQLNDINGDGQIDLVLATFNTVRIAYGDGQGGWSSYVSMSTGSGVNNILLGDMNGDGVIDIMTRGDGFSGFGWFQGSTPGVFGSFQTVTGYATGNAIIGRDLNRDGRLDMVLVDGTNQRVRVLMNTITQGLEGSVRVSGLAGSANNVDFRVGGVTTGALESSNLGWSMISSIGAAKRAETAIKKALETLILHRTRVAAAINRLEKIQDNIATTMESQEGARSSIADLDVASEMTSYTSKQMMVQAGIAMLSQASKTQHMVAELLKGGVA
ncbi:MAG: hypothetical protein EYC62_04995, partial [Alphaproteobacteria bacterium]